MREPRTPAPHMQSIHATAAATLAAAATSAAACRLALLHNNTAAAVDALAEAAAWEDQLGYMEPPR